MPILTKQSEQAQLEEVQKKNTETDNDLSTVAATKGDVSSFPSPPKFTDKYEERAYLKGRLVLAYRLFAKWGFDEGVAGHITIRVRIHPSIIMKRIGLYKTGSSRANLLHCKSVRSSLATPPLPRPSPRQRQRRRRRRRRCQAPQQSSIYDPPCCAHCSSGNQLCRALPLNLRTYFLRSWYRPRHNYSGFLRLLQRCRTVQLLQGCSSRRRGGQERSQSAWRQESGLVTESRSADLRQDGRGVYLLVLEPGEVLPHAAHG